MAGIVSTQSEGGGQHSCLHPLARGEPTGAQKAEVLCQQQEPTPTAFNLVSEPARAHAEPSLLWPAVEAFTDCVLTIPATLMHCAY